MLNIDAFAIAVRNVKAVAFDFDGVLVDSAHEKWQAYRDVFDAFPEENEALIRLRESAPSVNRLEFFDRAIAEVWGSSGNAPAPDALLCRLSEAMVRRVSVCAATPCAGILMDACGTRSCFIVSLTPQDDLRRIVNARGFELAPDHVFGRPPWQKRHALRHIIAREQIAPCELMFVGDSQSDRDAALAAGTRYWHVIRGE